jgi:hypothetical protein
MSSLNATVKVLPELRAWPPPAKTAPATSRGKASKQTSFFIILSSESQYTLNGKEAQPARMERQTQ